MLLEGKEKYNHRQNINIPDDKTHQYMKINRPTSH